MTDQALTGPTSVGDTALLFRANGGIDRSVLPTGSPEDIRLVVEGLPVEFHCHGIGGMDFSRFRDVDLEQIETMAAREGIYCLPVSFVPYPDFEAFLAMMRLFERRRAEGLHRHLVGFAMEGPILASVGGTPADGVWLPSKHEWTRIAECGSRGLQYIVLSPDALESYSPFAPALTPDHPDLEWIVRTLLDHGVRPSLGHFLKEDPRRSAECVERCVQVAHDAGARPYSGAIITDHLFNDMPQWFVHCWRTAEDRLRRDAEFAAQDVASWELDNLVERCGPVPAALMRAAHDGDLVTCVNFDGDHVDIEIARRAAEIVGSRSVIAMTDRTDSPTLGNQVLRRRPDNTLYYQADGIVAAGTQHIHRQIGNLLRAGMSEHDAWMLTSLTPLHVLGDRTEAGLLSGIGAGGTRYVGHEGHWTLPETVGARRR
ncbi:hypothetical protein ACWEKT_08680 [Nocardia takedensis]